MPIKFYSASFNIWKSTSTTYDQNIEFTDCSFVLTDDNGVIKPPGFSQDFDYGLDCTWHIINPREQVIEIRFLSLSIEFHSTCRLVLFFLLLLFNVLSVWISNDDLTHSYDFLTVYDGGSNSSSMMGRFCGSSNPQTLISSTNQIFLHFQTNSYGTRSEFTIEYSVNGISAQSVSQMCILHRCDIC